MIERFSMLWVMVIERFSMLWVMVIERFSPGPGEWGCRKFSYVSGK